MGKKEQEELLFMIENIISIKNQAIWNASMGYQDNVRDLNDRAIKEYKRIETWLSWL